MENKKTFTELGLSAQILAAIEKKGFEEPTAIQTMAIPAILKNENNIIAQAQTGTGKTAAFGLPLIDVLDDEATIIQALVLVPTRELALQVAEEMNSFTGSKNIKIAPIYGGQSIEQQMRRLRSGIDIIVGTPGRIIDHLKRKTLKLKNIKHLVIDEADEMLNMGFIDDLEAIMQHTNENKKTFLFSATMPERIKKLAKKYMQDHTLLTVKKNKLETALTEQIYFEIRASDKFEALCRIIDIEEHFYGMVFCRTKSKVDSVVSHLTSRGYDAEAIHGDISQVQRERTLGKFKKQQINIMVVTDVAARGIDVNNLTHVINYSLPQNPESYVHRIGRTGRAGNEGTAITFITPNEYKELMLIQKLSNASIKKSSVPKVQDIIDTKQKKIHGEIMNLLENDVDELYYQWAHGIIEKGFDPLQIAATLLHYCFDEKIDRNAYSEVQELTTREDAFLDKQGKTRLVVALGKKDNFNAKKIAQFIGEKASIKPNLIKNIEVTNTCSFITVPFERAEKIILSFQKKGKRPLVRHAKKQGKKK